MALTSPGVEVTIIDQSQYLPAPTNSVPFVLLATAEDKANPNGTGVAAGTTAANAGKLFRVTSQRDLVNLYGTPLFYTTSGGDPIQGYELNEYGLLAAYSALGAGNSIYCLRADVDLASLVGSSGRPVGAPNNGAFWLDSNDTTWGINEFNATTGTFALQSPVVITESTDLVGGYPSNSLGNIGSYAVNALQITSAPTSVPMFFYKNASNQWVGLGTKEWLASVATVTGSQSNPTLNAGDTFTLAISGGPVSTITVPVSPNNTVSGVATEINSLGFGYVSASVNSAGRLEIFSQQDNLLPITAKYLTLAAGTGTVLTDLGITAGIKYQPNLFYGTSAQQPLWQAGQSTPRPTGSVWIKIGSQGNGLVPVMSEYSSASNTWVPKNVTFATSDQAASAALDSTGGQAVPAGTVYAQYSFNTVYNRGPVYFWERAATGPTVVVGNNTAPTFTAGPYTFSVAVSQPGTSSLTGLYVVSLADETDAQDFVEAWQAANIPYTTASVLSTGAIQLTHTLGGDIVINDAYQTGVSNGVLAEAGFIIDVTDKVKEFNSSSYSYTVEQVSSTGVGSGLEVSTTKWFGEYNQITLANGGSGYAVGEVCTFSGADLGGTSPTNDLVVKVTAISGAGPTGPVTSFEYVSGTGTIHYIACLSNWVSFEYDTNEGAPVNSPPNNTNWYYSVVDQVDIMVNYGGNWKGYKNQGYDSAGFPSPTVVNATDPNGPIISSTEPTLQSDGTALVYGDLWIDTSDLENYPLISRWQSVDGEDRWVVLDNSDQTNATGIVFADARWAANGTTNPADDPIPTISSLLTSNYLDIDAPSHTLYPVGMLLFNTRRSGYNVKQYRVNYFNSLSFPDQSLPTEKDAWVSISGLQSNGAPYMGRKAQRAVVVQSLRSALDTNMALRDEDNFFNLIACPNYPELQPNMVLLNSDRGETGYILGDTPMRLPDDATAIQAWATNAANVASTGEDGCVTRSQYMALFYPSGLTADLQGNLVAVPASHMMLRTFLRNDTIAYPWLAAAGTRRGIIDNATNIGYLDGATGEFVPIKTRIGIRDVLYTNFINPLVFFTGNGLLNYGNKSSFTQSGVESSSALDRTNVARLVAFIRRQLTIAARPFVFEPNDAVTRAEISGVVESLMLDLLAKRGIYDYLVVCDETNNTPERIDRNELWIDVAIEPTKAAEFIYIPVRILNTGELTGNTAAQINARPV